MSRYNLEFRSDRDETSSRSNCGFEKNFSKIKFFSRDGANSYI